MPKPSSFTLDHWRYEKRHWVPYHPDVATSLNNLAALYRAQGRYADAEPLYKRSLLIKEKAFGPDHSDVALSLNNFGLLYQNHGRYAEAKSLLKTIVGDKGKSIWSGSSRRRRGTEQSG